jgi:hypothetical protein
VAELIREYYKDKKPAVVKQTVRFQEFENED